MTSLRKYGFVGLISARSMLAYLGEVATSSIFLAIILFIFFQLWQATYKTSGQSQLAGLSLAQMLWYLAMTEAITTSRQRVAAAVDSDVRTGAVAVHLLRPLSYPFYRLWTDIGERGVSFGLRVVVATLIALVFVGPIGFSPVGLLLFLLSLPLAFLLDFLGFFVVGLLAFWIEDTSGLSLLYSRLTMILGGMLIPIELFPDPWQPIVRALPFSSTIYGPAKMFVAPQWPFLLDLWLRQGLAVLVFATVMALIYTAALKKINSNGG
jgi:ABC-2 type transport system permease protein